MRFRRGSDSHAAAGHCHAVTIRSRELAVQPGVAARPFLSPLSSFLSHSHSWIFTVVIELPIGPLTQPPR